MGIGMSMRKLKYTLGLRAKLHPEINEREVACPSCKVQDTYRVVQQVSS